MKTDRATEINKLHESFNKGLRTTIQKAIHIGELLTTQKKECGHGNWIPWIETNLKFDTRMAQKYMRCYSNKELLDKAPLNDLTITEFAKNFSVDPNANSNSHLPPQRDKQKFPGIKLGGLNVVEDPSHTLPNKTRRHELPDVWKFMDELRVSINEIFDRYSSRREKLEDLIRDRAFIHNRDPGLRLLVEALRLLAEEATEFADKLESPAPPEPTPVSPEMKLLTVE